MNDMEKKVKRFITSVYLQDPFAVPIAKFLIIKNANPNVVTFCGLLFSLAAAASYYYDYVYLGAIFFFMALVTDSTDGRVARGTGRFSEFGKQLDAITDKVRSTIVVFFVVGLFELSLHESIFLLVLYFLLPILRLINAKTKFWSTEPTIVFWYNTPLADWLDKKGLCGLYCGWERAVFCLVVSPILSYGVYIFVGSVLIELVLFVFGFVFLKLGKKHENYHI